MCDYAKITMNYVNEIKTVNHYFACDFFLCDYTKCLMNDVKAKHAEHEIII